MFVNLIGPDTFGTLVSEQISEHSDKVPLRPLQLVMFTAAMQLVRGGTTLPFSGHQDIAIH